MVPNTTFRRFLLAVAAGSLIASLSVASRTSFAAEPSGPSAQDMPKPNAGQPQVKEQVVDDLQQGLQAVLQEQTPTAEDEEFYELLELFADTLDQVERNYVEKVSRRELMEAAIQGVLEKLDQYSDYIPPDELASFRSEIENEFGGLGIRVGKVDGQLTIITPLPNTPAYRAGLRAGDRIVAIDGESTEKIELGQAVDRMKGRVGTAVDLTIRRSDDEPVELVRLTREQVHLETVLGLARDAGDGWDYWLDPKAHIAYVRITSFGRQTPEDLRRVLQDLRGKPLQGLVLDLRFNPGGLLTSAIEIADLFLDKGTIVSTEGRNAQRRSWFAHAEGTIDDVPMAVLVNRYSASASEIVAASLQDHQRATIIGERTWGKGSVQNVIELEGGRSALKLTTAGYQRPSGRNIHRTPDATDDDPWGVIPDAGFRIRLNPVETQRLLRLQQDRDIIRRHDAASPNAHAGDPETGDPETGDPETGDPETGGKATDRPFEPVDLTGDRQLQKALDLLISRIGQAKP